MLLKLPQLNKSEHKSRRSKKSKFQPVIYYIVNYPIELINLPLTAIDVTARTCQKSENISRHVEQFPK